MVKTMGIKCRYAFLVFWNSFVWMVHDFGSCEDYSVGKQTTAGLVNGSCVTGTRVPLPPVHIQILILRPRSEALTGS